MKRLEVRCCCHASKLLGTLPVSDDIRAGDRVSFAMMQPIVLAAGKGQRTAKHDLRISLTAETFAEISAAHPKFGIAFKAEDVSIEQLRLVPGFVEAAS